MTITVAAVNVMANTASGWIRRNASEPPATTVSATARAVACPSSARSHSSRAVTTTASAASNHHARRPGWSVAAPAMPPSMIAQRPNATRAASSAAASNASSTASGANFALTAMTSCRRPSGLESALVEKPSMSPSCPTSGP